VQIDAETHPNLFSRQLWVLQARGEGVPPRVLNADRRSLLSRFYQILVHCLFVYHLVHQILRSSLTSAPITKPQYFWTKRAYNTFGRVCIFTDAYILAQVLITDEWAGKVKAVVKEVKVLEAKMDTKMDALNAKVDAKMDALNAKVDAQGAKMDTKVDTLDAKMDAMLAALQLLSQRNDEPEPEPEPEPESATAE